MQGSKTQVLYEVRVRFKWDVGELAETEDENFTGILACQLKQDFVWAITRHLGLDLIDLDVKFIEKDHG
jgi:hypothetical protein